MIKQLSQLISLMSLNKFLLRPTMTNSLQPLKDLRKSMTNVCLRQLRNPFRTAWSSLCKLRRVITSMLAMRRSLLSWPPRLTLEKMSPDQSKSGREKTPKSVLTRIERALLLLEKVPRNPAPSLMMRAWKTRWLLYWRKSMTSHALLSSKKMISNHIQMLNHNSTSSSMTSRLKFWKWNEIFEIDLIKFKVAKLRSENQESALNLKTQLVKKNELFIDSISESPIHPKIPVA